MPGNELEIPADRLPTQILAPGHDHDGTRAGRSRWRRFRTLRWRLTLTYAVLLVVLLLVLALVLNVAIGRVLYAEEFSRFQTEARASVTTGMLRFDALVNGRKADCSDALSYQQAFSDAINNSVLPSHSGIQQIYLLDDEGIVLAPTDAANAGADGAATQGPYVDASHLRQLDGRSGRVAARQGVGAGQESAYLARTADGGQVGIALIPVEYHTASRCVAPTNTATGIVEVVTTFPRVRNVLTILHLLMLASIAAVLLVGVVIGGPLTSRALRPLTRMTQAARAIASGDLSQRVRLPHGGDEIGELADTFDEMAARIETAFAVQQASEARMRQFIADASHELRTPLTSIRGYTDVLLRGAKDDPATTEQVLLATRREAERMSRLVNDLLTLARLDAGRPLELQPVNMIALVGEAIDQARILAGEREVAMRTDGGGRLMVMADADRLKQVLLALLDNSLKYGRPATEGWVRAQLSRTDRAAVIHISDNGRGIAAEDLPHIFDRFYRAQRAADVRRIAAAHTGDRSTSPVPPPVPEQRADQPEGSGLGLAIAQAIVRAHGGTLNVQSKRGVGTTFTIMLPLPHASPKSVTLTT
jgi:two-component system OmpR family sensor kinase